MTYILLSFSFLICGRMKLLENVISAGLSHTTKIFSKLVVLNNNYDSSAREILFHILHICQVASVVSDSVRPHRWQPTSLPRPWDSPGKNTGVGCHFLLQCMKVKSESEVVQSCPTLIHPMDCSLPGSSVHGIFQARVLE